MLNDYVLKFIVIGETRVGKTSLCERLSHNIYTDDAVPTIGVDFSTVKIRTQSGKVAKCQLWDTAGCERFRSITRSYYKDVAGALIVFDVTCKDTFNSVNEWLQTIQENCGPVPVKILLLGNKVDKSSRKVSISEAIEFSGDKNIAYADVSAKLDIGIYPSFKKLVEDILSDERFLNHPGVRIKGTLPISLENERQASHDNCCCKI